MKRTLMALALTACFSQSAAWAAQPTLEEKVEILQRELDELKALMAKQLAMNGNKTAADSAAGATSGGGATAAVYQGGGLHAATTIGGYGELTYNRYRNSGVRDSEADLRRFVLFFGHRFNDNLRFVSELEVEHAVTSKDDQGEVELEQAYIDYRVSDALNFKAGLFLMPLGLLNETHEPPTYYGVERNFVETRILPSTWREGGFGVYGEVAEGLRYDAGIVTGFSAGKMTEPQNGIRAGHQEMQLAKANDLSVYGALNYRGRPGLLVGGGIFTGNTGQNGASLTDPTAKALLKGVGARLTLWDLHAKYAVGNLDLQALYARGTLRDADTVAASILTEQLVANPAATGVAVPKSLYGWYGQAAYKTWQRGDMSLTPFVRYEKYNTQQQVASGYTPDPLNNERILTAGVNFKLHPQVVLKADYQKFKTDSTMNRLNLGVGYMF